MSKRSDIEDLHYNLRRIAYDLDRLVELKEQEVAQQRFFIELIEECLPINDGVKRSIHQRTMGNRL